MKVELKAGAAIEVVSPDELRDELRVLAKVLRRSLGRPRTRLLEAASEPVPASGVIDIDVGAPPVGMAWDVRRISVTGQDPAGAPAGVAWVYRAEAGNPLNYIDHTTTALPEVSPWDPWQFTLRQEETLYIRITGGTVGARYFVNAQALELPNAEVFERQQEA